MSRPETPENYTDLRCGFCHRMFCRAAESATGELQMKCSKCKKLNIYRLPIPKKENKISTVVPTTVPARR